MVESLSTARVPDGTPLGQMALWEIDRAARLDELIAESNEIIDRALAFASKWEVRGIIGLFSGGNDSTVLAHLIRDRVTHYAHANTQVGAEPTRQFVRDTCAAWACPLIERKPPGYGYEDLVLRQCPPKTSRGKKDHYWGGGFPGWNAHNTFFGKLKGDTLRVIRSELIDRPTSQRVVFMDGRRGEEGQKRRMMMRDARRTRVYWRMEGSEISVSPLLNWTKLDLNEYRRRFPEVPHNETADLMHKSMECACGCYAAGGEMAEIETWLPELADYLHGLEWRLKRAELDINPKWLTWGWGRDGRCASGMCNV